MLANVFCDVLMQIAYVYDINSSSSSGEVLNVEVDLFGVVAETHSQVFFHSLIVCHSVKKLSSSPVITQ